MSYDVVHWFRRSAELPVVLLHGFTGSAASWLPVVERMSARTVVALHLPGHHPDAPVAEGWDANIAWVGETLKTAGIDRCQLVGYSLGARTALGVSVRRPDLVSDAVYISVHPGLTGDYERDQRRDADARWVRVLRQDGIEAFVDQWEALAIFGDQSEQERSAQRTIRLGHDPQLLADSLAHMGLAEMPDYRGSFRQLDITRRVVVGEQDRKFVDLAQSLTASPIRVGGAGHNPLVARPGAVANLLGPLPASRSDY